MSTCRRYRTCIALIACTVLHALITPHVAAQVHERQEDAWTAQHGHKFEPGDDLPYGFRTTTLDGAFELNHTAGYPLIVHAYLPQDARLRYMWSSRSDDTISAFLRDSPEGIDYLFVSYGANAAGDVRMMQDRLTSTLQKQGLGKDEIAARLQKFHFAVAPMTGISDEDANFLPYLMAQWPSSRSVVSVHSSERDVGPAKHVERLDSPLEWIQAFPPSTGLPLVPFGNGCTGLPLMAVTGIALVVRTQANCSVASIIRRAQAANATAVLISSLPGEDIEPLQCHGSECDTPVYTFASSITYQAAVKLHETALIADMEGRTAKALFTEEVGPGYYAAIDHRGKLQELGWIRFPTLQHLSWAAQWLRYRQQLDERLEEPAFEVPIINNEVMQGEHGIVKEVELPPEIEWFDKLELDFALGCPGTKDADCPIWDHVVQLFVCCGNQSECDSCESTLWTHLKVPGDPTASTWESFHLEGPEKACGRELGRWITPFRRRVGRWLTDVTPIQSLLKPGTCTFTLQTAPWALPWKPSLSLRFSVNPAPSRAAVQSAGSRLGKQSVPLFVGGVFDQTYNQRAPLIIQTPPSMSQALLYVSITGHGSDENNCAEFCVTQHVFTVNGWPVEISFDDAGTLWNCTTHVLEGGIPNEHGTWQYGRGGWCDGINVPPHVIDVTEHLVYEGLNNTITYQGYFNGKTPDPKQNAGYIMMQSSLEIYLGENTSHVSR